MLYFPTATVQNDGAQNTWSLLVANVLNVFGGTLTVPPAANQFAGLAHATLVQ